MFKTEDVMNVLNRIVTLPKQVDCNENVMKYGVDSITVMKLIGIFRRSGYRVTFPALMEKPTIQAWCDLLNQTIGNTGKETDELKQECSETSVDDTEPFALTDVQYAYWAGRGEDQVLGGVDCHAYYEFKGKALDVNRLKSAWNKLLMKHRALRMRIEDGKQRVGASPYQDSFHMLDLSFLSKEQAEIECRKIRERISHRTLNIEEGETVGLTVCLLPKQEHLLCLDVALIVADVKSIQILLRDLRRLYLQEESAEEELPWNFRAYLEHRKAERKEEYETARRYWEDRAVQLPHAPALPLVQQPEQIKRIHNTHYATVMDHTHWTRLGERSRQEGVTLPMTLLSAYAEVIHFWSRSERFLMNVPLFDRAEEYNGTMDAVSDFTTLLLLEQDFSSVSSFSEQIRKTQSNFIRNMHYAACSGVEVQRMMQKHFPHERVFAPVVFACNLGLDFIDDKFSDSLGAIHYMVSQTPQVWIDCQTFERSGALHISWDVCDSLFPKGLPQKMFDTYIRYLKKLAEEDSWKNVSLYRCEQIEYRKTVEETKAEYPLKSGLLTDGLRYWADRTPDAPALYECAEGNRISYAELYAQSTAFSTLLIKKGVTKGSKVAVVLPRGIRQIVAIYGILLAQGIYVPVSYQQPKARLQKMIDSVGISYVVSDSDSASILESEQNLKNNGVIFIDFDQKASAMPQADVQSGYNSRQSPEDTAYIIMTSGSTGAPKGVEIAHQSAWNTIQDVNHRNGIGSSDRFLGVSAIDFDLSVYDIFGSAMAGGTLYVLDEEHAKDADFWLELVVKKEITVWNSVPILFDMFLTAAENGNNRSIPLKRIFLSGDWISTALTKRIDQKIPDALIVAMGGATEASIWSNECIVPKDLPTDWKHIPYGSALAGQMYRIVDRHGRDLPDWVTGELWIGGFGTAKGYAGDEEKTTQKFTSEYGLRWYHTGDLGRFGTNGMIEFLGRKDDQVKIKGHRVELGEIESAVMSNPMIDQAIARVIEMDQQKQIVLYYSVMSDETAEERISETELSERLQSLLPSYMLPKFYLRVDSFPLTENGKLDRKHLPEIIVMREEAGTKRFRNAIEEALAEIWKAELKIECVHREDDYFELGGDSLNATRTVAKIKDVFGIKFKIGQIFRYPSLAGMAGQIEASQKERIA